MIPKDFSWINGFLNVIFPAFPSESVTDWKFKCILVPAGNMQLPENLRIIKRYYFKILCILLHLLRKVRWRKSHPEYSALLLSVIMLRSLAKSWSQGKCQEFCNWSLTAFTTQTLGLWDSACDKDCPAAVRRPHGKGAQRSGVSFTSTKPGPSLPT